MGRDTVLREASVEEIVESPAFALRYEGGNGFVLMRPPGEVGDDPGVRVGGGVACIAKGPKQDKVKEQLFSLCARLPKSVMPSLEPGMTEKQPGRAILRAAGRRKL